MRLRFIDTPSACLLCLVHQHDRRLALATVEQGSELLIAPLRLPPSTYRSAARPIVSIPRSLQARSAPIRVDSSVPLFHRGSLGCVWRDRCDSNIPAPSGI